MHRDDLDVNDTERQRAAGENPMDATAGPDEEKENASAYANRTGQRNLEREEGAGSAAEPDGNGR